VDDAPLAKGGTLQFAIPSGPRLGTKVLQLHGVSKAFDGKPVLKGLDLEIEPGTRLGIIGPNGAGKTTLLKLCEGLLEADAGEVVFGETVVFASIDQRRSQLDLQKTVLEEVAGSGGHVRVGEELRRVEGFLDQFLFPGDTKRSRIGKLSGGERNRVLLAKLLCVGGNVLLLDEPTNDLDLMTLRALEEALVAFPGAVLVVSHDRYFLDRVATRVLHLDTEGHATQDACDVSRLLEKLANSATAALAVEGGGVTVKGATVKGATTKGAGSSRAASSESSSAAASASGANSAGSSRLSNWDEKEYDGLPEKIAQAEQAVEQFDVQLADPALYAGPVADRTALEERRQEADEAVQRLYARWEELEAKRGP
jgi:ATP-binding cassette subfamily F protein uup